MVAAGADILGETAAVELASTRPRCRALIELEEAVVTQLGRRHLVVQPLDVHLQTTPCMTDGVWAERLRGDLYT